MTAPGLYIERSMRTTLDQLWLFTRDPGLHQRWDLRFSTITYLPAQPDHPLGAARPQQFEYATRIAFGIAIRGHGESTGERNSAHERTSALRFWSADWKALIAEGSGYWKYLESPDAVQSVRFFTWYDYRTRFGLPGRLADRLCFRPLMGWATAWSFDRLRLWLETETPPEQVLHWSLVYTLARLAICFIWLWHGVVPKLLFPQPDELDMLLSGGVTPRALPWFGAAEIVIGLTGLIFWRWRGFLTLTGLAMLLASAGVAATAPRYLIHAFNPVTLNLAVVTLAATAWIACPYTAFAGHCLRRRPEKTTS